MAEKPACRAAFEARRRLIPAAGAYEWVANGGWHKQPHHIQGKDGQPFALAGLWERWRDKDGQPVETCTTLTTEANGVVRRHHDRMPVVAPGDFASWLDSHTPPTELPALLRPYPVDEMERVRVGRYVSNARNEGPQCLEL